MKKKLYFIPAIMCAMTLVGCGTSVTHEEGTETQEITDTTHKETDTTTVKETTSIQETTVAQETTSVQETTAETVVVTETVVNNQTVQTPPQEIYPSSERVIEKLREIAAANPNDETIQKYAAVSEWRFQDIGDNAWIGRSVGETLFLGLSFNGADFVIDNEIVKSRACSNCSGLGMIPQQQNYTCSICGGSGQQYIPNAYHDVYTGWHGMWQACGGCAGLGYTSSIEAVQCPNCGGAGFL